MRVGRRRQQEDTEQSEIAYEAHFKSPDAESKTPSGVSDYAGSKPFEEFESY